MINAAVPIAFVAKPRGQSWHRDRPAQDTDALLPPVDFRQQPIQQNISIAGRDRIFIQKCTAIMRQQICRQKTLSKTNCRPNTAPLGKTIMSSHSGSCHDFLKVANLKGSGEGLPGGGAKQRRRWANAFR